LAYICYCAYVMVVAVVVQEVQYQLPCEPSRQVEGVRVFTEWSAHSCWWPCVLYYTSCQVILSSEVQVPYRLNVWNSVNAAKFLHIYPLH